MLPFVADYLIHSSAKPAPGWQRLLITCCQRVQHNFQDRLRISCGTLLRVTNNRHHVSTACEASRIPTAGTLQAAMAAVLPSRTLLSRPCTGCCDRQANSGQARYSTVAAQTSNTCRSNVRSPSISCQACKPRDIAGSDRSASFDSSQFRAGPSGNAETNGDIGDGPELGRADGGEDFRYQQSHSGQSGSRPPVVTSGPVGTVVICGWLGSNKRYLKKYQDWWTENR